MTAPTIWTEQAFVVATNHGPREVNGLVWGPFGLHATEHGVWTVTHLKTGYAVVGGFTLQQVMQLCAEIRDALDWERVKTVRKRSPLAIRAAIQRVRHEAVTL